MLAPILSLTEKELARKTKRELIEELANLKQSLAGLEKVEHSDSDVRPTFPEQRLLEAIEAVPSAFALFDPEDRLVTCNQQFYRFRELPPEEVRPGTTFESLLRIVVERGMVRNAPGREEEFIRERMERHRNPSGHHEVQRANGSWWRIHEQRVADGSTLYIAADITDEKAAERQLKESEERYRNLIEGSIQGILIHRNFKPLFANQALADIHGYDSPAEILALDSTTQLQAPGERARMASYVEARAAGRPTPGSYLMRGLRKDGSLVWRENIVSKVMWEGEEAMLVTTQDVSERKRAEEELRFSQERIAGILDIADDAIISVNDEQRIVMFNKGAERTFGYRADEVMARPLDILLSENFREEHRKHLESFAHSPEPSRTMSERAEVLARRKDGEEFPAEASISKLKIGEGRVFTVILRDITRRKQTEEALGASRRLLQTVFDTMPNSLWIKDRQGRYLIVNNALAESYGIPPEDFLDKHVSEVPTGTEEERRQFLEADRQVIERGERIEVPETPITGRDGQLRWRRVIRIPLRDDAGEAVGVVGISEDITERKRAEEALRASRRLLRTAFDAIPHNIAVKDTEGRYLMVNKALCDFMNVPAEAFLNRRAPEIPGRNDKDKQVIVREDRQFLESGKTLSVSEYRATIHDGRQRDLQRIRSLLKDENGIVTGILVIAMDVTERLQAEQQAKAAHERLVDAVESLPQGFALLDPDDRLVLWNEQYAAANNDIADLLEPGVRFEELIKIMVGRGTRNLEGLDPDEWVRRRMDFHNNPGNTLETQGPDGRWFLVSERKTREGGTTGVWTDITERKKAERQAQEAHGRLMDAVESISQGFVLYDAEDRLVLWNQKFAEINADVAPLLQTGISFEAIIQEAKRKPRITNRGTDPEEWARERLESHRNPGGEVERAGADGGWFLVSERKTREGGTAGVWTDITDLKRVEEALRAREEQLQLFIRHAPAAVAMFDRDMRYLVHSRRWVEDFNLGQEDLNGRYHKDVFPETPDSWSEAFQSSLAGTVERREEDSFQLADGTLYWVRWETHPWRNLRGEINGVVMFTEVINERKKAEAQLIRAQRMEAVGQITGGVAHEFNNLLHIVQSYAYLLGEELEEDEKLSVLVKPIKAATQRGTDLVKRLLAFSRRQLLQPKVIDLNQVTLEMIELLRPPLGEAIELTTVTSEHLWPVKADQGELENALLNLALNARDAMPQGGKLTINTRNWTSPPNEDKNGGGTEARRYVVLAVSDSGSGMTTEVRERAFEPFFTTKGLAEHSGLGLSMVHGFVNQSGGYVEIESEQDSGTTIALFLPSTEED